MARLYPIMTHILRIGLITLIVQNQAIAAPKKESKNTESTMTQIQKIGYSFGYLMGKSNQDTVPNLDINSFETGFKQGYLGKPGALSEDEIKTVLLTYKKQREGEELIKTQLLAAQTLAAGTQFLAQNAKKSGIMTTASGLQYEVLKAGHGAKPSAKGRVKVHYEGKLLDGTVFDSSIARGEPVTFPLADVIAGWTEGLQLMQEGAKYRFYIPANLGYSDTGAGSIPPNSTLIFDVELLQINPPETPVPALETLPTDKKILN